MTWLQTLPDPLGLFKPIEARRCEQNGINLTLFQFAQARVDIATEFDRLDVGPDGEQLSAAALAAGSDDRAVRQRCECCDTSPKQARPADRRVAAWQQA